MSDKQHNVVSRVGTITIVTSDTVTTGTATEVMNGEAKFVEFTTAAMQDTDSTDISIVLSEGGTVYASGTVAESTGFSNGTVFPVFGTHDIVATAEGTQSGNREIPYNILFEE